MSPFDFIIIGAGTAGCLLANRLTASGKFRVLLIEAGGSDCRLMVRMPIGYGHSFYNPKVNWCFETKPLSSLAGRRSYWPRGKILGGSSSINAMIYVRGQRDDFNDWRAAGNIGWGWDDVLPHFKSIETFAGHMSDERGGTGEIFVHDMSASVHSLCYDWLRAAEQAGFQRTADYNGLVQEGVAIYQATIRRGLRVSSATAFLHPVLSRKNLTLMTNGQACRILFANKTAIGVEIKQAGERRQIFTRGEVIVSAGAVHSPILLQHSGVGAGALIQKYAIPLVKDMPAVGQNLQDHLGIDYLYRSRVATLNSQLRPWWGRLKLAAQYLLLRNGAFSLSVNQAGGFVRSQAGLDRVDAQLYFTPVSYSKPTPGVRRLTMPDAFPGFFIGVQPCRPTSRGFIEIGSPNSDDAPIIDPNYLASEQDRKTMLANVRLIRHIARQDAMAQFIIDEMRPGREVEREEDLMADIAARSGSVFHASCTCRMGPNDGSNVVDVNLRVHGLERLRVIDASIFPNITSGNINAPTLMVAEKGAKLILQDSR